MCLRQEERRDGPLHPGMSIEIGRRSFLRGTSLGTASLALGSCATLQQCQQQIAHRPTRRNIDTLAANDPILVAYRSAITQMQALPSSDPRNWTNQAQIHQNHCPHGNWLLLPWHRAYLYYFERICRKLSGMADFALPYWDWSQNQHVPSAFWPPNAGSLLDANRVATSSSAISTSLVGPGVLDPMLDDPNFLTFASGAIGATDDQRVRSTSGPLESTPHNSVHGFVGGDMGAFMSPLDPIFWTHHAMLDRCWVEWNITRNHPNSNDPAWTNRKFTDFCDENGAPVEVSVIETVLYPIFSYQYDTPIPNISPRKARAAAPTVVGDSKAQQDAVARVVQSGAELRLDNVARFTALAPLQAVLGAPARSSIAISRDTVQRALSTDGQRVLLTLSGTSINHTQDFSVRVFVNRATPPTAAMPDSDPSYMTSFSFFGHDHSGGADASGAFKLDATAVLRRLGATADNVQVDLVLAPFEGRTPQTRTFSVKTMQLDVVQDIIKQPA
jgi:tyrosinase